MSTENITEYLNAHLGGSMAALDLLAHLQKAHTEQAPFYQRLHQEITADQTVLKKLLGTLDDAERNLHKAVGWMAEKVTRLKFQWDGLEKNHLGLLEALEMLTLGIQGKKVLWRALLEVADSYPAWAKDFDFSALEKRARDQRDQVEVRRLEAAHRALQPGSS
jgi:hypothetical protein